ncbi:MAG TPA: histidine kinase dimerization/phosphoacceptor domain -containing protein [Methanobacteriaceae archaeon]|nr:histidine kinase dimerization/phosphoacceptor domain -containing protein [Methanobacteriaceae archaeon]
MLKDKNDSKVEKFPISFQRASLLIMIFLIAYIGISLLLNNQTIYFGIINYISITVLYFFVALSLLVAAKQSKSYGKRAQIAWGLLTVSVVVSASANILWGIVTIYFNQNPITSIANILYLSFYPLFIAGILIFPSTSPKSYKRFKYYFDVLIVLFSASLVFWAFFIAPTLETYKGDYISLLFNLCYVIASFLMVFALVDLISRIKQSMQTPFLILLIGVIVLIITNLSYTYEAIQGIYSSESISNFGWLIGYSLIGLAGVSQFTSHEINFKKIISPYIHNYEKLHWTPYVALLGVLISYTLIIWAYNTFNSNSNILEVGIGILIFLVVVRQIISIKENRNLYLDSQKEIKIRKEISKSLKKSETNYKTIFDNTGTATIIIDESEEISLANTEFEKLSGYSKEELNNGKKWADFIFEEDKKEIEEYYNKLISNFVNNPTYNSESYLGSNNSPGNFECKFVDKKGQLKNILLIIVRIPGTKKILASLMDVTEQRKAEEQLKKSLGEKEMLIKEIHHRVKNNLMVISSLLSLQSQYIKNKDDLEMFEKSKSRAKSMALIHERLYQSKDLKRIDFGEYIEKMATDMFNTYISDPEKINLEIDVENTMLDINTTIPLGLILNELLNNSIKYAFPDGRKGTIRVVFSKRGEYFQLTVEDDGIGFPDNIEFENTDSLGLQLINSLTEQIDGTINLNTNNGASITISFKDKKY